MKDYLTPSLLLVNFDDKDVMVASTLSFGEDNYKGDTLTPDDMGGWL